MVSGKMEEGNTQGEAAEQSNSMGEESAIRRENTTYPEFKAHTFHAQ